LGETRKRRERKGPYRRRDELGDHLIHVGIPLHGIPVLDTQRIKKGIRPVAKVFPRIIPPQRVLVVGEALDIEELPGRKGIIQHAAAGPPSHLGLNGAGRVASEGEREH
jgi:hypothetical protein